MIITPKDLKGDQMKVVVYSKGDLVMIVPDPTWNMKGDLTRIPTNVRKILQSPSKNAVKRRQAVISANTQTKLVPCGKRVLNEITRKGYFESDRCVRIEEMVDTELKGRN